MITIETLNGLYYLLKNHFDDKLLLQEDVIASGTAALKQIALAAGAGYVVNFPGVSFYSK